MPVKQINLRIFRLVAVLLAVFCLLVSGSTPALAAPKKNQNPCLSQTARILAIHAEITAHNSRPHVFQLPQQQAAYQAYNAEAATLNQERVQAKQSFEACISAATSLTDADQSSLPLDTTPPKERLDKIIAAKRLIPPNWKPSGPDANGYWRVDKNDAARALFDALRDGNPRSRFPNVILKNTSRPGKNDLDPAYPAHSGRVIGVNPKSGNVAATADHIIPLAEIINTPGFMRLTPQNMYMVTRAPVNFQWLSYSANYSKSSRSVALMSGVDSSWQSAQVVLEREVRAKLTEIIAKLLASQT
jgi:hypothetical protein